MLDPRASSVLSPLIPPWSARGRAKHIWRSRRGLCQMDKSPSDESLPLRGSGETRHRKFASWATGHSNSAHFTRAAICYALPMMTVVALGVAIGWAYRTRTLAPPPSPPQFDQRTLSMGIQLDNFDPLLNGGTITVQWSIEDDTCIREAPDQNDLSACPPVNLYMDPTMFAGGGNTPSSGGSNIPPSTAVFQFVAEATNNKRSNLPNFETSLIIGTRSNRLADTLLNYPFDRYTTELWIFAEVNGTQEPVSLALYWAGGVAFGYDTEITHVAYHADIGSLDVTIGVQRTALVRAYVVTIVIAMWLITLLLLAIAIKAVFFRCEVDTTILAAPVSTLFAFTTLRSAMPGSPSGFGAIIDFVGTLPSLATLIAITVVCLLHVLLSSKRL